MDRALAAATYMATPKVRPTANFSLELHYIRALFIQQNYRQCIHACQDVLRVAKDRSSQKPLQKTFVLFYLAVAHDELARAMHSTSQAKLPAFNSAEYYLLEAIRALPSIEEVRTCYAQSFRKEEDIRFEPGFNKVLSRADSFSEPKTWQLDPESKSSGMIAFDHPARQDSLIAESLAPDDFSASDFDDHEDRPSIHAILSSSKPSPLPRDFSRMSLVEAPLVPHSKPQSHGLMRPIRLGSPPKPYISPISRSPRLTLQTNLRPSIKIKRAHTEPLARQRSAKNDSPVSPLDPEDTQSDTATISPVSPTTPPHDSPLQSPRAPHQRSSAELLAERLDTHLSAFRIQLETHIALVQQAKQHLFRARANRVSSAPVSAPSMGTANASPQQQQQQQQQRAASAPSGMQQLHHYWSQAGEGLRRAEKLQRIQEGRQRKWTRTRFQPERYRDLAENALAEL